MPSSPEKRRTLDQLARTFCCCTPASRFQNSVLPSSMPRSVTTPVMCVVRMVALDILVSVAFCTPIMKDSSSTVMGTANSVFQFMVTEPTRPKSSMSKATSSSGRA